MNFKKDMSISVTFFFYILKMFEICTTALHNKQQREYDYYPKTERLHQCNVLQSVNDLKVIFSSDCTGNQELLTLQTGLK